MKRGHINPLNVTGAREVQDPPVHFQYVTLDLNYNLVSSVTCWIWERLKYRFYVGETLTLVDNEFKVKIKFGFEDAKEASFFLLACPFLQ